jgi:uncharacterized MAPEG superfamily protein
MTPELRYLLYSVLLGLVYVFLAAALSTRQRGVAWNVGNRDGELKPLSGAAARAERASRNFLETFPFFAAVALAVVLARANTASTALGAQLYFFGRLLYLPLYVIGIPYLRTLAWAVAFWGLLQVLSGLL